MGLNGNLVFANTCQNIKNRIISFRFVTLVIMLLFIFDMYLGEFRANVNMMELKTNVAVLPFLQTRNFFMKMVLLGFVYFYSNVPFMEREQLFVIARLGKRRWGRRNLSYIVGSGLVLTLILVVISIVLVLPVGTISPSWDAVYKTVALTGGSGQVEFRIDYHIMRTFAPLQLLSIIMLLDWMVIVLLGMGMYAISLFGYRTVACVMGILFVFLPSIDAMLPGSLLYVSPASWLDCKNWRVGFDNTKPDLAYMLVAGIFLIFLLAMLCQSRVQKMEWRTMDN